MACASTLDIYQLKITLRYAPPPIWRRILVPKNATFQYLHFIIIEAMGWSDTHLHEFRIGMDTVIGVPDKYDAMCFDKKFDEKKVKLSEVLKSPKDKVEYWYDFSEDWRHYILLEKILPRDSNILYPVCIAGRRECPPEHRSEEWLEDNWDNQPQIFNHKDIDLAGRVASRAQKNSVLLDM